MTAAYLLQVVGLAVGLAVLLAPALVVVAAALLMRHWLRG